MVIKRPYFGSGRRDTGTLCQSCKRRAATMEFFPNQWMARAAMAQGDIDRFLKKWCDDCYERTHQNADRNWRPSKGSEIDWGRR